MSKRFVDVTMAGGLAHWKLPNVVISVGPNGDLILQDPANNHTPVMALAAGSWLSATVIVEEEAAPAIPSKAKK